MAAPVGQMSLDLSVKRTIKAPVNSPVKGLKPHTYWASKGVRVQLGLGDYADESRETSISFLESERMAEITTSRVDWQKSLEASGAKPESIQVFKNLEFRWYVVPKTWVGKPGKQSRMA